MTDRKALDDQNETPEDVATLYSWANLHGAKYRDFSVSRAQTREKARLRVQEAIESERRRVREEAEAQKAAEAAREAETIRRAEAEREAEQAAQQRARLAAQEVRQQAAQLAAQQAAQEEARQHAAQMAAQQAALEARQQTAQEARQQAAQIAAQQANQEARQQEAQLAARQAAQLAAQQAAQQRFWQRPQPAVNSAPPPASLVVPTPSPAPPVDPYYSPQPYSAQAQQRDFPVSGSPEPPQRPASQSQYASLREESYMQQRNRWAPPDPRETPGRPAWLVSESADLSSPPIPPAPEDTLQGSRDRLTSRWFALKGVFEGTSPVMEVAPAPAVSRAPVLAVFSLAGGVGKTSLVATLGRALSARGERILLVDTAAYGLLPFFFGARDQLPGMLRTFSPPGGSGDAAIQMVTIDPETLGPETAPQEALTGEISKFSRGVSRVIVDLATASGAITRRVLKLTPTVLVPVIPDMNSVVSVSSIDAFFHHNSSQSGKQVLPYYVLNQFDPSLPLHLDVREVLREQLGDRLLPFALRRTPQVSEALAEGLTVMDYAPNSTVAEDFGSLAGWAKSLASAASTGFRGVRWSER